MPIGASENYVYNLPSTVPEYREMKLEVLSDFGIKVTSTLKAELEKRNDFASLDRYCHDLINVWSNDHRVRGSKYLYELVIPNPTRRGFSEREIVFSIGKAGFNFLLEKGWIKEVARPLCERYYVITEA